MSDGLLKFLDKPAGQGLLAAIAGGMATARRGQPWNTMGRAGMAGLMGMAGAQDRIVAEKAATEAKLLRDMQMAQMQGVIDDRTRKVAAIQKWQGQFVPEVVGSPQVGNMAASRGQQIEMAGRSGGVGTDLSQYQDIPASADYAPAVQQRPATFGGQEIEPWLAAIGPNMEPSDFAKLLKPEKSPTGFKVGDIRKLPVGRTNVTQEYQSDGTWKQIAVGDADRPASINMPNQPMAAVPYIDQKTGKTIWGTIKEATGKEAAKFSPELQRTLSGAVAGGKVEGVSQAEAKISLPQTISDATKGIALLDAMVGSIDGKIKPHPGFKTYVGATLVPGLRFIEGGDTAAFEVREKEILGGTFLAAFETLKGGGHITEIEGVKATQAMARMNKALNEKEYTSAAREYQGVLRSGVNRAKIKAATRDESASTIDNLLKKYK